MSRVLFSGATVLDGVHPPVPGQTVVVEGERIAAVEADDRVTPEPDDEVIAVGGATLMPGMVQAHWHGSYAGLDFECPPVGLEQPPGYLMLLAAKHARLALDRGFTGVIGAAVGDALDAQLKAAIADGVVVGPRIMASGRWLITTGDSNDLPEYWWWKIGAQGSQRICDGADEFRKAVRQEIKEGAEIIKIFADSGHALLYGSEFVSMSDAELEAAVEATHDRGRKIRCHVTAKAEILRCVRAGVDVLDHVDQLDAECIEAIVEAGTFVCPSLYLPKAILETVTSRGEGQENEPFFLAMRRDYEHMCEILGDAAAAGMHLLVGDDWGTAMTPHGDYVRELEVYADEAGIAPLDILRWATVHGAECMDLGDELGTIAPGKLADLIVVRGDPSTDVSVLGAPDNPRIVMLNGRIVRRED